MSYEPEPLDTSAVALSPSILRLTERLARHAHEVWARERLRLGWTYGPVRDDVRREHPCLVPYDELPDSEKQLDRNAALETVKALLVLGYRLEAPPGDEG
jgi:ryanodine receptor 2